MCGCLSNSSPPLRQFSHDDWTLCEMMKPKKILSGTRRISMFRAGSERREQRGSAAPARCTCSGDAAALGNQVRVFVCNHVGSKQVLSSSCARFTNQSARRQTYVRFRGGRAGGRQLDGSVTQQPVHRVHSRCCPSRHTGAPPRRRELMEPRRRTLLLSLSLSLSLWGGRPTCLRSAAHPVLYWDAFRDGSETWWLAQLRGR